MPTADKHNNTGVEGAWGKYSASPNGGSGGSDRVCPASDWDGYDAFPVQKQTFENTYLFIEALPLGFNLPSIGAEPDGCLTLDWYRHPRWTLSVSVNPEGILYYAALFGSSEIRGSEVFSGEISKTLLDLIQRVHIA